MEYNTPACKKDGSVELALDPHLYCSEAILKTSYLFTDRCYVTIAADAATASVVAFMPKKPEVNVEMVVCEFLNELIDQQLRVQVQRDTADIQRLIISEAFAPLDAKER